MKRCHLQAGTQYNRANQSIGGERKNLFVGQGNTGVNILWKTMFFNDLRKNEDGKIMMLRRGHKIN
jgi:hypothetical protein